MIGGLTNIEAISYLLNTSEEGEKMPGTIRTKERCPICSEPFQHFKKLGLICLEHKTIPKKYFIDLYYKSRRIKLYSHKSGRVLDSYALANETLGHVHHEIRTHVFDPSKYIASDVQKFYFENLMTKWLDLKESEGIATAYKYRQFNDDYYSYFKGQDVRELRTSNIHEFYSQIKNISNKTKKNIMACLHVFFNWLIRMEYVDKMPVFPTVKTDQPKWQWMDESTQGELLLKIPEKDRQIFIFLALHGCRPSEARALKVKDLDFKQGSVTIRRTFSGQRCNILVEHTKSHRERVIPINPLFAESLKPLCSSKLPEAFLFTNPRTGRPYSMPTFQEIWQKAREAVGVKIKAYEGLRHSFASQRICQGADIYLMSKILGHTDIRTTQRYSHTNLDALKKIMVLPSQIEPLKKAENE